MLFIFILIYEIGVKLNVNQILNIFLKIILIKVIFK